MNGRVLLFPDPLKTLNAIGLLVIARYRHLYQLTTSETEFLERPTVGRGSLLTCGDVEVNPGPNMPVTDRTGHKNVSIQAQRVNVQRSRPKRKRRSGNKAKNTLGPLSQDVTNAVTGGGRVTDDPVLHEVCGESICPSEGAIGWMYKYVDPAGAVESGKALGEFSKVPDGLLRYSVDGEQRPIVTEECPSVPDSDLPLDGRLWSISFISFPAFRLNYIAVANTVDEELDLPSRNALIAALNNIVNWRDVANQDWVGFAPNWYYRIRALPNTLIMAEDNGRTSSVTQFRKAYKGITFEFNAPTLIDQGWWVGGHIPVKPQAETIPKSERESLGSISIQLQQAIANVGTLVVNAPPAIAVPITPIGAGSISVQVEGRLFSVKTVYLGAGDGFSFTPAEAWAVNGEDWADATSVVTFVVTTASAGAVQYTLTSNLPGATVLTGLITTVPGTGNDSTDIYDLAVDRPQSATNRLSIELPALTSEELTTNNPKIEQYLCKESGGAYIVHYKMNNPVFEMTGEENYGAFQFHYPEYNDNFNALGLRGIVDTFENNFSSAVVHFRGISQSATIVTKTYDGWEGTTNTTSVVGQFAHAGAQEEDEVVQLANRLQAELTGVYPADDNFAATVSALASWGLGKLMTSQATPAVIKGIAQQAVGAVQTNPGLIENTVTAIGSVGKKLVQSIKNRRARRRANRRR